MRLHILLWCLFCIISTSTHAIERVSVIGERPNARTTDLDGSYVRGGGSGDAMLA